MTYSTVLHIAYILQHYDVYIRDIVLINFLLVHISLFMYNINTGSPLEASVRWQMARSLNLVRQGFGLTIITLYACACMHATLINLMHADSVTMHARKHVHDSLMFIMVANTYTRRVVGILHVTG